MPRSLLLYRLASSLAILVFLGSIPAWAAEPARVSYFKDVRPIFQQSCNGCHQPARPQGGYVMTSHADLFKPGERDKPGIVAGQPKASYLIEQIRVHDSGKAEMPKGKDPLNALQIKTITDWITQGAADDTPASAKVAAIDPDHPPVYRAPPVITDLAFSPAGGLLAVTGYHEILLYNPDGSELLARLIGMSERIQSIAFSPSGKLLAAAGGGPGRFGEIQVWDIEKRQLKISCPITFDTVYGLSWSPDETRLAVGCADNTVRAIDPATGLQTLQMGTHSDWVLGTAFSQDGLHLVSVSRDMSMKLTEVATQRFIDNVTSITPGALKGGLMAVDRRPFKERKTTKVPDDQGGTSTVKVYDELITAGADGIPRLYKMHREKKRQIGDDSNKIREYEKLAGRVSCIRFSPDGMSFIAASSLDGKGDVRVYSVEPGKKIICERVGPAYTAAWSADGNTVASAGFDGKVWLHDPATGKLIKEFVVMPK